MTIGFALAIALILGMMQYAGSGNPLYQWRWDYQNSSLVGQYQKPYRHQTTPVTARPVGIRATTLRSSIRRSAH